jgi:two-component system chemotaxis sensor kinase CheA
MDLDEIQAIFFQECDEGLAMMESHFAALRDGGDDETINTIFRAVHSIKGGAGAFGHELLQTFTHHYETVLDKVRDGELKLTPDLISTIMMAFDMLADHVAAARGEGSFPDDAAVLARLEGALGGGHAAAPVVEAAPVAAPAPVAAVEPAPAAAIIDTDVDDLLGMFDDGPKAAAAAAPVAAKDDFDDFSFDDLPSSEEPAPEAEPAAWVVRFRPGAGGLDNGSEPLLILRELTTLGGHVVAVDAGAIPGLHDLVVGRPYVGWTLSLPATVGETDIRDVFEFGDVAELDVHRATSTDEPADIRPAPVTMPGAAAALVAAPVAAVAAAPVAAAPVAAAPAAPVAAAPAPVAPVKAVAAVPAPVEAPRAAAAAPAPAAAQTIRVDLDKLDRLVNLVGELVITQAMLAQRLSENGLNGMSELTDLDHLTRELQDSTMAIRAQPMKTVFSRVPRIIRELETGTGKKVRLEVEGEMTEVDKTVVERIGEPLTHLIRNAVDHGIESPAERLAAGKGEEGVVKLSAAHQSGRIVITIADDGRGIDRVRVRAKAVEKGIIAADAVLSDEEIDNLIFAPGFSTAAVVSNISGRGVGMDVVRKNVQALGGRIGIASTLGKGSSFSLSLPLTLAVLDGMIVTVGAQTFVIPLSHIVESLRPKEAQVRGMGPGATVLDVRGAYVPVHQVGEHLGIPESQVDPANAVLIVVESDKGQAALMVDGIQDQRQVVVKSLETNYQAIHGLAGATILGDGRVALILDVDGLINRWRREGRAGGPALDVAA